MTQVNACTITNIQNKVSLKAECADVGMKLRNLPLLSDHILLSGGIQAGFPGQLQFLVPERLGRALLFSCTPGRMDRLGCPDVERADLYAEAFEDG